VIGSACLSTRLTLTRQSQLLYLPAAVNQKVQLSRRLTRRTAE
jgi:hypothetical protein